ncbi:hypothetical protein B566_EDAN017381 [Ephemera danica]|nr:hypothetical protein B566_EDAN017381 [Ephemera danica]
MKLVLALILLISCCCCIISAKTIRIPEFRIPPYDPLEIPRVQLDQGNGPVAFQATFIDLRVVDLDKLKLELRLFFPRLRIQSNYEVDGRVLVTRKGLTYISLRDRKVNLNIEGATMHFENLFNGNKQLGDTTNRFFNENWRDIVNEIRPVLEETIAEVIHGIVRQVFDLFPLEQLLPTE